MRVSTRVMHMQRSLLESLTNIYEHLESIDLILQCHVSSAEPPPFLWSELCIPFFFCCQTSMSAATTSGCKLLGGCILDDETASITVGVRPHMSSGCSTPALQIACLRPFSHPVGPPKKTAFPSRRSARPALLVLASICSKNMASLRSAGMSMVVDMPRRLQQLTYLDAKGCCSWL